MKASIEIQADILKTMMSLARDEIQSFRSSVYSVISALTIGSFALTAFLLKPNAVSPLIRITDGVVTCFIWGIFWQFKRLIREARRGLVSVQNKIENLDKNKEELHIFEKPDCEPDISDNDLWWIPIVSTLAIGVKDTLLAWYR